MFSAHIVILAQGECIPQVLHSFEAIKPSLSVSVSTAFNTSEDRHPRLFRERFGEGVGLVKSAFSQSSRVQRHGYQEIRWNGLYSRVLDRFDEILRQDMAQMELATVLEPMDQVSQYASCLISGHYAIESRCAIFAVRAGKFSFDETLERSGAAVAEWRPDARRSLLALVAEKTPEVLRMSTPDTIGGVEQLKQRINQYPNRISHAGKLSKSATRVRAGSEPIQSRR